MSYFGATQRMVGDPGFFGSLKSVLGRGIRTGVGFVTGGVGGAIAANLPAPRGPQIPVPTSFPTSPSSPMGQLPPGFTVRPGAILPGGAPFVSHANGSGGCPKGYQPAKVYVRGQGYQRIGHCVKIRTRNPYNRRAATRASQRLSSLGRGMKTIKKSVKKAARELD